MQSEWSALYIVLIPECQILAIEATTVP